MRKERLTEDVDAISKDQIVPQEAVAMAKERGLPENWLNSNAIMWMPPLPPGVLDRPDKPGLRVTFADDPSLFATKLVAQRVQDADDVIALANRLGMGHAKADELEAHIRAYYTDRAALEFILDGDDCTTLHRTPPDCSRAKSEHAARLAKQLRCRRPPTRSEP